MPVTVAFSRVTGGSGDAVDGSLELTKWYSPAPTISGDIIQIDGKSSGWDTTPAAGLYAGTLDSGNKLHLYSAPSGGRKFVAVYKAHITIGTPGEYGGINWTEAAMKQELAKRKAQINLSAAKYSPVAVNDDYDENASYFTLSGGVATPTTPTNSEGKITSAGAYKLVEDTTNGRIRFLESNETTVTKADGAKTHVLDQISLAGIADGVDAYFGVRVEAETTSETGYIYAPFMATVADDGPIS